MSPPSLRRFLVVVSLLWSGASAVAQTADPPAAVEDVETRDLAPVPADAAPLAPVEAPEPPPPPPASRATPPAAPVPVPAAAAAPTFVVSGRVLSRGTREPLPGAEINFSGQLVGETDADGRFSISLPPGRQRLQLQQPGFDPADVFVEVGADDGARVQYVIRLSPRLSGSRYETVVIAADRQAERTTLRAEELTRTPGSFGDPLRTVESLPGVSQVVWPLAIYTIRGANPGNTGFFVDGVRMPMLHHFALGPSTIHPFFIEQVDFYPGGYPARFGRYVSGVVNASTQTPTTDRARGSADLRLFDAGGIVVTPFHDGQGTIAVAGRVSYTGLLFSLFSPDYTFNYWDYQARVEHKLGPGKLTLFAFGAGDSLGRKQSNDLRVDIDYHRADLNWRGRVAGGALKVGLVAGHDASATFIPQVNNLPVSVASQSLAARLHFDRALSDWAHWEIGTDTEWQHFTPQAIDVIIGKQEVLERRTVGMASGYLALGFEPRPWLSLSFGGRYDLYAMDGLAKAEPSPRVNARVKASEHLRFKGAFGRFTQLPSLPIGVPGFENFGLRSFGLQKSIQGSLGFEADLPWLGATLDTTAFIQRMDVTDLASIFNYDVQTQLLEMRPGRSYGVEVMLRRALSHRLYGWLAYTLSKSERVLPQTNARAASDWDQRHILNLVASYRLGNGYQIGTRVHYNSGRPYPVFNQASLTGNQQAVEYMNLPDFFQLDVRFDKRWVLDKYVLEAYVEMVNTTLSEQVFDIKRRNDSSLDRRGFRLVLPSIGLRAEW